MTSPAPWWSREALRFFPRLRANCYNSNSASSRSPQFTNFEKALRKPAGPHLTRSPDVTSALPPARYGRDALQKMPPAYISSFPAGLSRALTNKTIAPGSPNSAPSPVPAGREPPLQLKPGSSRGGGRSAFRGSMAGATSPGFCWRVWRNFFPSYPAEAPLPYRRLN